MLTSSPASITEQTSIFALGGTSWLLALAVYVLTVVALWKVFTKAGYPGWLSIIPIVNVVFLTKIAGFSGWFALLYLIPIVGVVFHIVVQLRIGRAFGHGWVFSLFLLVFLYIIGYLVIGFSDDRYRPERLA
ncbi:DUF5684 domain-containing protein [Microbacterium enclense]|uniref:DUF5684 domain-containing protein n=1 Tax=Microbacterium enclense TaxID=993073 RepID=UPI00341CA3F6